VYIRTGQELSGPASGEAARRYNDTLLISKGILWKTHWLTDQRVTSAETMDWNTFIPSVPPSSGSAERSGCGIIPTTL
jgi:hypothetical protein